MAVPAPARAARRSRPARRGCCFCVVRALPRRPRAQLPHQQGPHLQHGPFAKKRVYLIPAVQVHSVLMLIGFIILGSEAIMGYKILPWGHDTNKMVHLLLHAVALFLGSVGIYAAFKFHNESGIANLYSFHSWVGLGTICLYGVQWMFGFVTFFFPGASPTLRRSTLPWHVRSRLLVYVLALLAAELGFLEKLTFLQEAGLGKYSSEALLVNFTAVLVILLGSTLVMYVTAAMHSDHTHGYSAVHKS